MPTSEGELAPNAEPLAKNDLWAWWTMAVKVAGTFLAHQLFSIWGVNIAARIGLTYVTEILQFAGRNFSSSDINRIYSGYPYYPVQIGSALVIGWLISRRFGHRSMLWVWVLPLAALCRAVIAESAITSIGKSVLIPSQYPLMSHFFGSGCRTADHCLDQLIYTVPFYITTFYSIGALLARTLPESSRAAAKVVMWSSLVIGLILLGGATIDIGQFLLHPQLVLQMMRSLPWPGQVITLLFVAGLAAMGGYLVRSAYRMRHKPLLDDESESPTPINAGP